MPYRIKEGQEVLLKEITGESRIVKFNRMVDFTKEELVASPLDEHHAAGIPSADPALEYLGWVWGVNVAGRWSDVGRVVTIFAKEIHTIATPYTSRNAKTVVVSGSGTNQYTLTLDDYDRALECSCRGFRYKRTPCKHMKKYNTEQKHW